MLFQISALIVGVIFFVLMFVLRSALSVTFPRYHTRLLAKEFEPPAFLADLYLEARQELEALGFTQTGWASITPQAAQPGEFKTIICVFSKPDLVSQVLVYPPVSPALPNKLGMRYLTWLADGRLLSSQQADAYAEVVADDVKHLGQTIHCETVTQQWQQHQVWRKQFNVAGDLNRCQDVQLLDSLEHVFSDSDRLLALKRVWRDQTEATRPTLRFALHILRKLYSQMRFKAQNSTPVNVERLMFASSIVDHQQQRRLPLRWQWGLFASSCLLFAAIAGVFFGWFYACALLGVIVLHESGHYLTMKMLGYKNVQMLALPLLGGATLGFENKPSANGRAWVSLMGPLPGIVLGWGLIAFMYFNPALLINFDSSIFASNWFMLAVLLLLLNYLNLLPIMPADGGHILQSLLPPRWFVVRIVLLVAGCLLAAAIAWYFEIYILVFISLLQLPFMLSNLLLQRKVIDQLVRKPGFMQAKQQTKKFYIFKKLNDFCTESKKYNPQTLINQAREIVTVCTQEPMKSSQRFVLASIYIALFVVPLFFIAPLISDYYKAFNSPEYERFAAQQAEYEKQIAHKQELAKKQTFQELLAGIARQEGLQPPAQEQDLIQAQARLGQALPDELKALYHVTNGLPQWGIASIQDVIPASQQPDWQKWLEENKDFEVLRAGGEASSIQLDKSMSDWLYLGSVDPEYQAYFYRLGEPKQNEGNWLDCTVGFCTEYANIRDWLEDIWVHSTAQK